MTNFEKKIDNLGKFVTKIPTTISLNIASIVYLERHKGTYFSLQLSFKFFLLSV